MKKPWKTQKPMQTRKKAQESAVTKPWVADMNLLDLYSACLKNASELLKEADLLLSNGHHPRAYFLAFTAFEELGKSQIVADYFSEMLSKSEFEAAFVNHRIKTAYINRHVQIPKDIYGNWFIEYDIQSTGQYTKNRNDSLYIKYLPDHTPQSPDQSISVESTKGIISDAKKYLKTIIETSCFNERIGTKAFTK